MMSCRILVYFLLVYLCKAAVLPQNLHEYKVFMPKISPQEDDEYWCYATEVPKETQYIVKYEAVAKGNIAHHMLIYGCNKPAHTGQAWQCGDICGDDESGSIMFAWARNAPPTKLPEDVGFEIGEHAKVNYIVVQIHYRRGFTDQDPPDESGLSFATTAQPQKYRAGILLMVTGSIYVPSHSHNVHADISCKFDGKSPIYPFGFRVHAHSLSTVISGYQYNGSWHLMGKGNPQWPQAFYPMDNNIVIKHGDILGGRCTYDSDLDVNTHVGSTHIDEMCNFYMMYYTNADKGKSFYECFGNDFEKKLESLPAGNDVPLPPNPLLEDEGNGHHHHHGMTTEHKLNDESTEQAQETNADVEQDQYEPLQAVELVPDWPSIQPDDHLVLGQVAGMHTDSKGNLHIFHRGSRMWDGGSFDLNNQFRGSSPISENTIITFDQSGKVLKQWGEDRFYMPHGLYIDKEDNIWVTDVALHQVMRFKSGSSEPDLVIGDKLQPGNHKSQFCKPADVIVLSTGDILVADGYCHARIAKFSNEGKFIKDWGKPSKKVLGDGFPPPSTFSLPHSLVELEKHKAVCVADRENGRIQCFDYDGHFIKQIHPKEFGSTVFAVTYCPDKDVLYVVNGPDPYSNDAHATGFTIDYNTGKLLGTWAPSDKGFSRPHDLTVANEGRDLYVGEIGPNKVWKFNVNMDKVLADSHQTMKRPGAHPAQTVDNSSEELTEDKLERSEEPDFGVSIVIGSLLVIPVLVIIIIVVFLRVRKRSREDGYKLVLPGDSDEESEDEDELFVKTQSLGKKVSFQTKPLLQNGQSSTKASSASPH